jgi:hypothetical protein
MMRLTLLTAVLVLVVLVSAPSPAQMSGAYGTGSYGTYGIYAPGFYAPGYYGPIVGTPEIHLGSATEPSIVRIPPVIVQTPLPRFEAPEYAESEPVTAAAMRGGFDFVVSPVGAYYPGSMDDSSVSLGEYARQLRSQKHGPPPIVLTPGTTLSH